MTPVRKKNVLQYRFRSLKKHNRFLKKAERRRRICVHGLRLSQKLRLDIHNWKVSHGKRYAECKKRISAKRETAKLNRTLKRRRRR